MSNMEWFKADDNIGVWSLDPRIKKRGWIKVDNEVYLDTNWQYGFIKDELNPDRWVELFVHRCIQIIIYSDKFTIDWILDDRFVSPEELSSSIELTLSHQFLLNFMFLTGASITELLLHPDAYIRKNATYLYSIGTLK